MTCKTTTLVTLSTLVFAACATSGDSSGQDGRADVAGFHFGLFHNDGYPEGPMAQFIAFHDVATDLPSGFHGQMDVSLFADGAEYAEYHSGYFQLYNDGKDDRVLLQSSDGDQVADFRIAFNQYGVALDDTKFYERRMALDDDDVVDCEAFYISDYVFEEGFTTWEYPSVSVRYDDKGALGVHIGATGFYAEDGEDIQLRQANNGDVTVTLTTSYDAIYTISVPNENPSRGQIFETDGGTDRLIASLVCASRAEAPQLSTAETSFTCHTVRPEASGPATISFSVVDLDEPASVDLVWPGEDSSALSPITVAPETSVTSGLSDGIANGYAEYLRGDSAGQGRFRIFTDSAGIEFGELVLYENSEYTRGWVQMEDTLQNLSYYSELWCERS